MVAALYRRYRPDTFADMIGQTQVTEPLRTALRTGRVHHAYLFSGPRGCGKTTSARVLARCLNCEQGPTDTPCGECDSCRELATGGNGSLDVIEIDAASHGGVDDARDLRERAVLAPSRDRYKIFIIDEAHMVTSAGFNALLKVVEEPPEHVRFVFATTEPEKVIGTIRSRTHHFPFRLIPPALMLEYVEQLCGSEGVAADPGVLPLVVRAGGGSARDTLSLLDQVIAGSEGDRIDYERAAALLGFTAAELLDGTIDALAAGDAAAAYRTVDGVVQSGQDPRRFVEDLLERVRDLIVVKATGQGAERVLHGASPAELDRLAEQAARFSPAGLSTMADLVNDTLTEMTGVTSPRLHLELMTARILVASRATFAGDEATGAAPEIERRPDAAGGARARAASGVASPASEAAPSAPTPAPGSAPASESAPGPASAPAPAEAPASTSAPASAPAGAAAAAGESAAAGEPPAAGAAASAGSPSRAQAPAPAAPASPHASTPASTPGSAPAAGSPAAESPAAHAPVAGSSAAPAPGDETPADATDAGTQPVASGPLSFAQLRDAWPTVLDRVKRDGGTPAWTAVQFIHPRDLVDDVLAFEVDDKQKLDRFRTPPHGGGPAPSDLVRAAIRELFGVTVKFKPRRPAGREGAAAPGGNGGGSGSGGPAGDADEHRAGSPGRPPSGGPAAGAAPAAPSSAGSSAAGSSAAGPATAVSPTVGSSTGGGGVPVGLNWTVAAIPGSDRETDDGPGSAWAEAATSHEPAAAPSAPSAAEPAAAEAPEVTTAPAEPTPSVPSPSPQPAAPAAAAPAPIMREPDDADRTGGHRTQHDAGASDSPNSAGASGAGHARSFDLDRAPEVVALRDLEARRREEAEDAAAEPAPPEPAAAEGARPAAPPLPASSEPWAVVQPGTASGAPQRDPASPSAQGVAPAHAAAPVRDAAPEQAARAQQPSVAQQSAGPTRAEPGERPGGVARSAAPTPPPVLHRPPEPAPGINGVERYGESVIRELLGARFISEEALPEPVARISGTADGAGAGPDDDWMPSDADAPPPDDAPPPEED